MVQELVIYDFMDYYKLKVIVVYFIFLNIYE